MLLRRHLLATRLNLRLVTLVGSVRALSLIRRRQLALQQRLPQLLQQRVHLVLVAGVHRLLRGARRRRHLQERVHRVRVLIRLHRGAGALQVAHLRVRRHHPTALAASTRLQLGHRQQRRRVRVRTRQRRLVRLVLLVQLRQRLVVRALPCLQLLQAALRLAHGSLLHAQGFLRLGHLRLVPSHLLRRRAVRLSARRRNALPSGVRLLLRVPNHGAQTIQQGLQTLRRRVRLVTQRRRHPLQQAETLCILAKRLHRLRRRRRQRQRVSVRLGGRPVRPRGLARLRRHLLAQGHHVAILVQTEPVRVRSRTTTDANRSS
mmetsp:Transcript_28603/g.92801  ORF Transcript_28603/g.92801 Transcript_28603/m.92801 type:complete len:318 (-) Transcript_28603:89-1042(-)